MNHTVKLQTLYIRIYSYNTISKKNYQTFSMATMKSLLTISKKKLPNVFKQLQDAVRKNTLINTQTSTYLDRN
ncbi:hypothetical protein HanPSC8_Chr04g0135721 [Helianthus annuus]|nr:hypothetical protein HanPSC8_Chr04g0135721 [Helianthus annuus]